MASRIQLNESNCQVAYCYAILDHRTNGLAIQRLAVKLQGEQNVVSFAYRYSPAGGAQQRGRIRSHLIKVLQLFMSQPKPILLVFNSLSSPFLPVHRMILQSDMVDMFYGVIAAFTNAYPISMRNIGRQKRFEEFNVPALLREVMGQKPTQRRFNVEASVRALESVVTSLTETSELIVNSEYYTEVILRGLNPQQLRRIKEKFRKLISNLIDNFFEKLVRPNLSYHDVMRIFQRDGLRGIEELCQRIDVPVSISRPGLMSLRWCILRGQQYDIEHPFDIKED